MKLEVSHQYSIKLKPVDTQNRALKGGLQVFGGLTLCFCALFIALFMNLLFGVLVFIFGVVLALSGIPMVLKEESLDFWRGDTKRIVLWITRYGIFPFRRVWDMAKVGKIEGRNSKSPDGTDLVEILLVYKNAEKEKVLSEQSSTVPIKCIGIVNDFIDGKEVPEGIFED